MIYNQTGKTKDVGFKFGIRKTVPFPAGTVWDFLFSDEGLSIWLGTLKNKLELKKEFETQNGITGFVRVLTPDSHIRISWKPKTWENISTVQLRVIGKENKTTIAIHQEKLLNTEQRKEMKAYWTETIEKLTAQIKTSLK